MEKEKISIVIPAYNVEKYIEHCLESVIHQTYKNLQIILVDDGATDKTSEICDRYAKIDNRIEVIHKPNGGLADARNKGLERVNGEYIAFLDSDDYIYPTFYEELYDLLKKYEADIAECDFLRIDIDNKEKSEQLISEENAKRKIEEEVTNNIEALKLLYGIKLEPYVKKVVVWNKLYKREIYEKIRFPLGKLHEDEYTTYKALFNANKIISTNRVLHGYMQTKNSIMRQEIKQKRIDDTLDAYVQVVEFFKKQNLPELEMKARRRSLENCIELVGKIIQGNGTNAKMQVEEISNVYKKNGKQYIECLKNSEIDENENKIVQFLIKTYEKIEDGKVLDEKTWTHLQNMI